MNLKLPPPSPHSASGFSAHSLRHLTPRQQAHLANQLTPQEVLALMYEWAFWARPDQLPPPGNWTTWLILAGRGWGKTRTGAEWIRAQVESGKVERIALVARTAADARDVMVEGESGLLAISPPNNRPHYEPSKRRLTWPNGAVATTYCAEEPDQLRGPQHHIAWADEPAAWSYPDQTWANLLMGLRLGTHPQVVATTTPKPTPLIRDLLAQPTTSITRGRTADNSANLAPGFLAEITRRYGGTRLGRQELEGELLDDNPDALWRRETMLDANRRPRPAELTRIVVAVDPAMTAGEAADETGIVVAGLAPDGECYVLEDLSGRMTPDEWAQRVVAAFKKHRADRVIAEVNAGGELVEHTLRTADRSIPFKAVRAKRGKYARAEPVAALYEQARVHHVGHFPDLEDQLCTWAPGNTASPDRLDALVYAVSELMLSGPTVEVHWL